MPNDTKVINDLTDAEIAGFVRALGATTTINRQSETHKKTFAINIVQFPLIALERFVTYGAQRCFNDAIGGADKSPATKVALVEEMIEEYKQGEVSKRRVGVPVDNVQVVARQIARQALRAVYTDNSLSFKDFTDKDKSDQNEVLDKIVADNADLTVQAEQKIAERKKASKGLDLAALGLVTS